MKFLRDFSAQQSLVVWGKVPVLYQAVRILCFETSTKLELFTHRTIYCCMHYLMLLSEKWCCCCLLFFTFSVLVANRIKPTLHGGQSPSSWSADAKGRIPWSFSVAKSFPAEILPISVECLTENVLSTGDPSGLCLVGSLYTRYI